MKQLSAAPLGKHAVVAILFLGAVAVGGYLRLHLLSSQILLDDEWHSINHVVGRGFLEVAANLSPRDNSTVPFNLYNWWLYRDVHWSEWTLRLPSIVAGILSLLFLPWLVGRVLGRRVAVVFAFLLAGSPILISYSRYARAYGPTVFLGFAVLLLSHRWFTSGRARDAAATLLVGTLAVYVHPECLVVVFVPLLIALGSLLAERLKLVSPSSFRVAASLKSLLVGGAVLVAVSLPVVWSLAAAGSKLPWAEGAPTLKGVLTALTLISGTVSVPLNVVFYALCLAGLFTSLRAAPLLGWMFLGVTAASFAVVLISRPEAIGSGLVLLRYMIIVVPVALVGAAMALDRAAARLVRLPPDGVFLACAAGGTVLAAGLYVAGPVPLWQLAPNNFTGHSAFQGSYEPVRWERSDARHPFPAFSLREDEVSPFYRWLRDQADVDTIVEYPFDVCNHNDLFYFYQHVHGKHVLAGYCSDPRGIGRRLAPRDEQHPEAFLSMMSADDILSRLPRDGRVAFRNMIDLTDLDALAAGPADIVVLHKVVMGMRALPGGEMDAVPVRYTSVDRFSAELRGRFGAPVYEDDELVCFSVRASR